MCVCAGYGSWFGGGGVALMMVMMIWGGGLNHAIQDWFTGSGGAL